MASNMILSEKRRKALFNQMAAAIFKEARKLSVSYNAKIGILIAKPGGSEIIAWPSLAVAKARFVRYLKSLEAERKRRIERRKKYLLKKRNSLKASLTEIKKENAKMSAQILLNETLYDRSRLKDLGKEEFDILLPIIAEKIQEIEKEIEVRKKNEQLQSTDADISGVVGVPVGVANDQGTGASRNGVETGSQGP